ncbi:hypothetical protein KJ885_05725, partial [Patescibacteria group bacterium]|nr:hypothetical protein [Patescibacteria group bacterium]
MNEHYLSAAKPFSEGFNNVLFILLLHIDSAPAERGHYNSKYFHAIISPYGKNIFIHNLRDWVWGGVRNYVFRNLAM